jgi:hypothetical protein
LDGGTNTADPLVAQRAEAKERYTGAKATADDKRLAAALSEMKFENDTMSMADWMYDSIAVSKVAYAKIVKMKNPRLQAGNIPRFSGQPSGLGLAGDLTANHTEADKDFYGKLLNIAFDEFDMLRFREAFFVNRIAKAVYWDLSSQLKVMQTDYAAAQKDPAKKAAYKAKWSNTSIKLLTMADNFVVDRLNNLVPKDLQASMLDQVKATMLHQSNMMALELFKDPLRRHISGLKSVVEGHTSDWEIQRDLIHNTVWNPMRAIVQTAIKDPKARKAFGWDPKVSFTQLVHRMVDSDSVPTKV